jgi:hypothetical protein
MVQSNENIIYANKIKINIEIYGHACAICGLSRVSLVKEYEGNDGKIYYNDLVTFIDNNITDYLKTCHIIIFEKIYKAYDNDSYIAELYLSDC